MNRHRARTFEQRNRPRPEGHGGAHRALDPQTGTGKVLRGVALPVLIAVASILTIVALLAMLLIVLRAAG